MDPEDEGEASEEPREEVVKHVSVHVEDVRHLVEESTECVLSLIVMRKTQNFQSLAHRK